MSNHKHKWKYAEHVIQNRFQSVPDIYAIQFCECGKVRKVLIETEEYYG